MMKKLVTRFLFRWLMPTLVTALMGLSSNSYAGPSDAMSGAWFDPAFEGAGFLVEALPGNQAVVYWFTYDDTGGQQWFVGVGHVTDQRITIDDLQITTGARFGDAFNADDVQRISVGNATIDLLDCRQASVSFSVDGQSNTQNLTRLTSIAGDHCASPSEQLAVGNELNQSGSWFNPERSGEGVIVQVLSEETAFINWFSYDDHGEQAWFTGIGRVAGRFIHVGDLLVTSNGRFGATHDPTMVRREPFGMVELELGCDEGQMRYDTAIGSGVIALTRLTSLNDIHCFEHEYVAPRPSQLLGQWVSDGFGMAGRITQNGFTLFQWTEATCLPVLSGTGAELAAAGDELALSIRGDRLRFLGLDAVSPVYFDRVAALPAHCAGDGTAFTDDILHNFDAFAATMSELYATFDVRGVNWDNVVAANRGRVSAGMSDQNFFRVLSGMLAPLGDGHVTLRAPFGFFGAGNDAVAVEQFNRGNRPQVSRIIEQTYLRNAHQFAANRALRYGMLDATTGYIEITRFNNIYPALSTDEGLAMFADDVDAVLSTLIDSGARRMVLDVRRNQGGDSKFGFVLASRFQGDEKRLVFSERRPVASGLSRSVATAMEPSNRVRFDGPAVLLTSRVTASAAEIFTMAMTSLPQVTVVGTNTIGVLSRTERILPNGWTISVTPGRIYDARGRLFEATGVPVDVGAPIFPDADVNANRDSAIDTAMTVLQGLG